MNVKTVARLKRVRRGVLQCSLCMFLNNFYSDGEAVTVINGQAVCADHVGVVQGGDHAIALRTAMQFREVP